jgi:hypothetical protein
MKKNLTRRQTLMYLGKAATSGAIYGTIGRLVGKGYLATRDRIKDYVGKTGTRLSEIDDKVEGLSNTNPVKVSKNTHDWRANIWRKISGQTKEKQADTRRILGIKDPKKYENQRTKEKGKTNPETEKVNYDRRGFLRKIAGIADENPVATGTGIGILYGVSSSAIKNLGRYLDKREIAILKQEKDASKEELETIKSKLSGVEENYKKVLDRIENQDIGESKLEKEVNKGKNLLLFLGAIGLLVSISSFFGNITGATIGFSGTKTNLISIGLFFISSITILLGISLSKT